MSKAVDLDLDALERLAKTYTREVDRMEMRPTDVLTLIQRLREAETELLNQQQLAADWQQRIARLERVREAAQDLLDVTAGFEPVREEYQVLGTALDDYSLAAAFGIEPAALLPSRRQVK